MTGCSTDCNSFPKSSLSISIVPPSSNPPEQYCYGCDEGCAKCTLAPTKKGCPGSSNNCQPGSDKYLTECSECLPTYFFQPNKDEPSAVIPRCLRCGPNCKKCKDNTECLECLSGWAKQSGETNGCTKEAPNSSADILNLATVSIIALILGW